MNDFKNTFLLIKEDFLRLSRNNFTFLNAIKLLLTNASFKITFWFRIGSYLYNKKSTPSSIMMLFVSIFYKKIQYKTGIQLPLNTQIGKGLQFSHFSCIVINSNSTIGDYCTIFQGVTIGSVRGKGVPKIGNNVVIAAGAKVIGNVLIGNNVFIGANSVVTKDIPDNSIVVGIPAKIINYNGFEETQKYLNN